MGPLLARALGILAQLGNFPIRNTHSEFGKNLSTNYIKVKGFGEAPFVRRMVEGKEGRKERRRKALLEDQFHIPLNHNIV